MKKYNLYFAFLATAAVFAILAACGSGDIIDLSDTNSGAWNSVNDAGKGLTDDSGLIRKCANDKKSEECIVFWTEPPPPPSSSELPFSSSEEPPFEIPSSSSEWFPNDPSSSGGYIPPSSANVMPPSSSAVAPSSSSSVDANAYSVSSFTCGWNPSPVRSGKEATVWIERAAADKVDGVNCKDSLWLPIKNIQGGTVGGHELVPGTLILVSWGTEILPNSSPLRPIKFPDQPTGQSAQYSDLQGTVTCSGGGKSAGNRSLTCSALTIEKPPQASITPNLPAFTNAKTYSASSIFYIGDTPTHNSPELTNPNAEYAEYCGTIEYIESWGGGPLSSSHVGNITVKARCSLSGQEWTSAEAAVVPDPTISGSCAWDTKNNTFGGGVSARVTTAPTIQNQYGRTCVGPSFFVGGTQKQTVAAGLTVDAWNGNSSQTMTGITIGATCGGNATATISCPAITVKDPNAMCEYLSAWCDGITLVNIKTANVTADPPIGQDGNTAKCFFATTITSIGNVADATVNGKTIGNSGKCGNTGWGQPTCASALSTAGVEATDGGYYIYVPSNNWTGQDLRLTNSYAPNLHPNCEAQK